MGAPLRGVSGSIHIVTTCTDRKRVPVTDDRRLREVEEGSPRERAQAWWRRLEVSPALVPTPPRYLYAGEHWTAALQLPEALPRARERVQPWVASAGYGLVGWDAPLKSYSATFAAGMEDSVVGPLGEGQSRGALLEEWWEEISSFPGPEPGQPRSIEVLARRESTCTIVVVASPDYVRAMQRDLLTARDLLGQPQRLIVVSNGTKLSSSPLAEQLVPVDARARSVVGGTMQGLNARVALRLFEDLADEPLTAPALQTLYEAMTRDAKKPQRPKGEPMTDDQVIAFIKAELAADPDAKQTRLLRKLRDSKRSCEQARFRGLYKQVTGRS